MSNLAPRYLSCDHHQSIRRLVSMHAWPLTCRLDRMKATMLASSLLLFLSFVVPSLASPIVVKRDDSTRPTELTQEALSSFLTPATFAADAYCTGLQSGSDVGRDGQVLWKAGNGDDLQMVYVAYSRSLGIVVAHQGTNKSSSASLQNDLRINRVAYDARLSNALPSGTMVADGFQKAWLDTADMVVAQVKEALVRYPNANVTVTGHSLGAAISLLDAIHLQQAVPNISVNAILFGMPRVGNDEFADAVDEQLGTRQRHVIHAADPIPHMPFRSMGFQHPSGQIWIPSPSADDAEEPSPVSCPGQENRWCADSVDVRQYDLSQHNGPYFGVAMGCSQS